MMAEMKVVVVIPRPLHERLSALKTDQEAEKGRQVSFAEIIEQLLDVYAEVTA